MKALNSIWNIIGQQYEVLVYERSRLKSIALKREESAISFAPEPDRNIERKILLTERILTALAELKDLENEI